MKELPRSSRETRNLLKAQSQQSSPWNSKGLKRSGPKAKQIGLGQHLSSKIIYQMCELRTDGVKIPQPQIRPGFIGDAVYFS